MEIAQQINVISKVFDINSILNEKQTKEKVKSYYLANRIAYRIFHNWNAYMHMGLSNDNTFKKEDLLKALHIVQKYINKSNASNVLELASGRGANSAYLAINNPNTNFYSIDLSTLPLGKYKTVKNYNYNLGSYDDLSLFRNEFDIVFIIEALCHSENKFKTLDEVYNKLKPGGYFIIIDAYSTKEDTEYSKVNYTAKKLVEKTMAVEEFISLKRFKDVLAKTKFKVEEEVNYSKEILPSLYRFQRLSKLFFKNTYLAKSLKLILGDVCENAIAGYLMPEIMEAGIGSYYLHVLKK